jgi:hypothetical protein
MAARVNYRPTIDHLSRILSRLHLNDTTENPNQTTMKLKHPVLCTFTLFSAMIGVITQRVNERPPAPALEWLLTYAIDFNPVIDVGDGPSGSRIIYPVKQGKFTGTRMSGEVFASNFAQ